MSNQKLILSWEDYLALIKELSSKIPRDKYSGITGISRGGLIPGVILSHELGIPFCPLVIDPMMILSGTGRLVVDDLVDSGATLSSCLSDIAVLYRKPTSEVEPTYWVEETDRWVVFPYEKE